MTPQPGLSPHPLSHPRSRELGSESVVAAILRASPAHREGAVVGRQEHVQEFGCKGGEW